MNIESLRQFCNSLPNVTEDIKWGNDLCFSVGGKMFCVASLTAPLTASFKVKDEEFDELSTSPGMEPAPYVAKHKWILVTNAGNFSTKEWELYIRQSYNLVKAKLPKKVLAQMD
jgi:predicted DNA-binding protein (MmcQ/YjbR family)